MQGRGHMPGPASGVYWAWTVSGKDLINSEASEFRINAPYACRVILVTMVADTTTSDPTIAIVNETQSADIMATRNFPASDTAENREGSNLTNRDVAKGDRIRVSLTADGGDALFNYTITILFYAEGHVNADPGND
jgi:hypothetical protein